MEQMKLRPFISKEEIEGMIEKMAFEISNDYRDDPPLLVGVLKGSFIFLADLVRALDIPVEVDFVRLSSYGPKTEPSEVTIKKERESPVEGRDVLLVEEILDTGATLSTLMGMIYSRNPKSLKVCALLDKHARRKTEVTADYLGRRIEAGFLVGYGLDFNEKYRNLPDIYVMEP